MFDIRQFRKVLYAMVIVGVTGFAYALEAPNLWIVSMLAIGFNIWLMRTGRFRPIPRYVANAVTILGLLLLWSETQQGSEKIYVIGQFLVLLQIVKLYEQRANRDYAQVMVLNLLQMVAAAVSTALLAFGIMLIAYLILAIYCCLLFHLKMETDAARPGRSLRGGRERLEQQDRLPMLRSLRRIRGILWTFGIGMAALMFIFFPRGSGAGFTTLRPNSALTGFNDSVSFQNVALITQNTQTIAWVKASKDGKPYSGTLLLRGVTLNRYTGAGEGNEDAYQWTRFASGQSGFSGTHWNDIEKQPGVSLIHQRIMLHPTQTKTLFGIAGITRFKADEPGMFIYSRSDQVLQSSEVLNHRITYEVDSTDRLTAPGEPRGMFNGSSIDPKIEEFARRPEVSGSDAQGPLAERRDKSAPTTELDSAIAGNIERYLRQNFTYTLDLTEARRIRDRDPLVAFLYDLKRGHCEYFAGAMTLMCQSLGMQARVVVGFRCDEYNPVFDYYNVRQSHAHAWVEVLDKENVWQTYDPTSSKDEVVVRADSWWERIKAVFGYAEYAWENNIIAYDQPRQGNLLLGIDRSVGGASAMVSLLLAALGQSWSDLGEAIPWISLNVVSALIAMIPLAFIAPIVWYLIDKWLLRRRARRIGLDALPRDEQIQLARQLGFYDDLLRLLERHRIARPLHLTPREFSDSLTFLPVEVFAAIGRLTEIFYRVRYGRRQLSPETRKQLDAMLSGVADSLGVAN